MVQKMHGARPKTRDRVTLFDSSKKETASKNGRGKGGKSSPAVPAKHPVMGNTSGTATTHSGRAKPASRKKAVPLVTRNDETSEKDDLEEDKSNDDALVEFPLEMDESLVVYNLRNVGDAVTYRFKGKGLPGPKLFPFFG